jgi:peptidoglycan/xylan/chitin deacetylase (PgdA/CDA1 family)
MIDRLFLKISYYVKLIRIKILFKLGFSQRLSASNQPITRILVFHGLDDEGQTGYNSRFISVNYFEKLLVELKKNYHFISLDDYYHQNYNPTHNNVILTFDDGLQNNIDLAIPVLEKMNIPATFFITSSALHHEVLWPDFLDLVTYYSTKTKLLFEGKEYIKSGKKEFHHQGKTLKSVCKQLPYSSIQQLYGLFDDEWQHIKTKNLTTYWQLMTLKDAKKIAQNPLFSIGAHSNHHPNLTVISHQEALLEMEGCKSALELELGTSVHQFAFPFGAYSQELITLGKNVGFTQLLALDYNNGFDTNEEALKNRFIINPHIGWQEQLYFIQKGRY